MPNQRKKKKITLMGNPPHYLTPITQQLEAMVYSPQIKAHYL